jgi:hypothetical protein
MASIRDERRTRYDRRSAAGLATRQKRKGICMIRKWRLLVAILAVAGLALTMGASAASAAPAHKISPVRMVSSLADIPSAGAAKMVGGKLELPRQTADNCAVVYMKGSSADLYLTAEGLNNEVRATSSSRDCWSTATFFNWGEFIYSGSGRCLADNNDDGYVVMQNCAGDSWQEWKPLPAADLPPCPVPGCIYSGTVYINDWAYYNTPSAGFLSTFTLASGTGVYATGYYPDQYSDWYS